MRCSLARMHPRSPRHTVRMACQVVREEDFRLVADRIVDLSGTGMLVSPADPVLTGQRLLVSFCLPRSTFWIDTEATVTRVLHGRRPGELTRALALQFDELHAFEQLMLRSALRTAPPVPPRFRPGRRNTTAILHALLRPPDRSLWAFC